VGAPLRLGGPIPFGRLEEMKKSFPTTQASTLTIRELYPALNEKEAADAEENLKRYAALVLRICERIRLTDAEKDAAMEERSNLEKPSDHSS
jgi:hypothetical protein